MTRPLLNMHNIITLAITLAVLLSIRLSLTGGTNIGQIPTDSPPGKANLSFYETIRNLTVPTRVTSVAKDRKEWLRAGVFGQSKNAFSQIKRIRELELDISSTIEIGARGHHTIWIGPFESRKSLELARKRLLQAKIDSHSVWR
jgi:hypothetical protein